MIIANATGCSSIYGGTFPTIPYCKTKKGRGPFWANSLFEDNAEYGFGIRLAVNSNRKQLKSNIEKLLELGTTEELKESLQKNLELWEKTDSETYEAVEKTQKLLPEILEKSTPPTKKFLLKIMELQNYFIYRSVWCIGGDGWAYDLGFGGLDHVIASGLDVNLMVIDTEVY